jgi:hypothetical protein
MPMIQTPFDMPRAYHPPFRGVCQPSNQRDNHSWIRPDARSIIGGQALSTRIGCKQYS